jgi:acetyl esterase/lipase
MAAACGVEPVARHIALWISAIADQQVLTLRSLREAFARYAPDTDSPVKSARRPAVLGGVNGCWFLPPSARSDRRIVYVHGGGFVCGDVDMYADLCSRLAEVADAAVFFVAYRLAPEHHHPAAFEDVVAAIRAAAVEGPDGRSVASRLGVAGDSNGAALSLAASMALFDRGERTPDAIACFSGWFDFSKLPPELSSDQVVTHTNLETSVDMYFVDSDPAAFAPSRGDLAGLPPLLIQAGSDEMLLPQSSALAERARAAGVPARFELLPAGHPHVSQFFWRELPYASAALTRAGRFLTGLPDRRRASAEVA